MLHVFKFETKGEQNKKSNNLENIFLQRVKTTRRWLRPTVTTRPSGLFPLFLSSSYSFWPLQCIVKNHHNFLRLGMWTGAVTASS